MSKKLNLRRNVVLFQGRNQKDAYFEGWYYRTVSADHQISLAIIPGISKNRKDPHAFIQVLFTHVSESGEPILDTFYHRYALDDFHFIDNPFSISLKENSFSLTGIHLNENENPSVQGTLTFGAIQPIHSNILSPNIMGFFGYVPRMECYHGIVSMKHAISGNIQINGIKVDFNQGVGYIEKDWGRSFPSAYVWLQANHFDSNSTSLMMSIATIPWLGFSFKGHIVSLIHEGREHRFATYNGSRILRKTITDSELEVIFKKGKWQLKVRAFSTPSKVLIAPNMGVMDHKIKEGMSGRVELELYEKDHLVLKESSDNAALEVVTNIHQEVKE